MDAVTESGRNPVNESQIQPESVENERADARRDGQTRLARPNSQVRTETGKNYVSCSVEHEQDWQPRPVDPYSAEIADYINIHT